MIKQEGISFKELEQEIYRKVCETGRQVMAEILEEYDRYLKENRDKKAYRNSLTEDEWIEKVGDLIEYFAANREGLLPYQKMDLDIPESPKGLCYRNMGTMENHVWSVIARRMKNNHTSWSRRGGNHLAKILAKKCSGKLFEVTERLRRPLFEEEKVEELYGEILMSAKTPKKDGRGYEYPKIGHVVGLDGPIKGEGRKLLVMAGY
jgi:hypothetical protein